MSRRSSVWAGLAIFILLILVAGIAAFRGVGRWLICEDRLAPADAIVVLSGSMPARAEAAADIFRMGYAKEIWVSRPENVSGDLAKLGISYKGEEDYNRDVLIREGVPPEDIHIFPDAISDTEQEVEEVAHLMRDEQKAKATVIIVTSPEHTRRVRALWHRMAGPKPRMIVRPAWEDPFDSKHWWRNTHDTFSVVREMLGLVNVWLGLPVRPKSS